MPPGLRSVTLIDSEGDQINADNVIGIDESGGRSGEPYVTVAVQCSRRTDIDLVSVLIENGLQPFKHKSSTIVQYGSLSVNERADRASDFLEDLQDIPVTWGAVISDPEPSEREQATAAAMAAKKSITNGLSTGDISHGYGETAVLHDGVRDRYSDYSKILRKQLASCCDSSFQRNICPVFLTYLQDADRTYPQSTAADYIAGYIRDEYDNLINQNNQWIHEFDASWIDPAPQADPVYQLDEFIPVREAGLRSRVMAWLTGRGLPQSPNPTGQDPYQKLLDEIDNQTVYAYLSGLE